VAVKVMRGGPAAGSERRHRFEREIRLLARLRHPALVGVHDSGEADGWFYLVMEFVEGTPIDEFVDASALARRESLELFALVCDAVHAAHQRGVIHRDLKPANILVDDAGRPHVLDFGLAKLTPESEGATGVTNDGRVLGTMAWASPEQASGRTDDIDTRTDIYSLGVVLYELMTGRLPYETSGPIREALDNIAESPPTPPRRLDPTLRGDIETIALKCLAKDRDRRYSTVAEVAADIRRSLAGEAIDARRDSRLYVMLRTLRRYRVPVSVGVACMLSGTAFGTVMTGMYRQEAAQHQQAARQVEELTEELKQLRAALVSPANWRTTFDSGDKLLRMDPDEALDLIRSAWAEAAGDVSARQQMLKAANVAELPRFVPIMDLGCRCGRSTPCAASPSVISRWTSARMRRGTSAAGTSHSRSCARGRRGSSSRRCGRPRPPTGPRCSARAGRGRCWPGRALSRPRRESSASRTSSSRALGPRRIGTLSERSAGSWRTWV
jgi:hypothetical protein